MTEQEIDQQIRLAAFTRLLDDDTRSIPAETKSASDLGPEAASLAADVETYVRACREARTPTRDLAPFDPWTILETFDLYMPGAGIARIVGAIRANIAPADAADKGYTQHPIHWPVRALPGVGPWTWRAWRRAIDRAIHDGLVPSPPPEVPKA